MADKCPNHSCRGLLKAAAALAAAALVAGMSAGYTSRAIAGGDVSRGETKALTFSGTEVPLR